MSEDYMKKVDKTAGEATQSGAHLGDEAIRASSSDSHPPLPDKPKETMEQRHDRLLRNLVVTPLVLSVIMRMEDQVKLSRILTLFWQIGSYMIKCIELDDPEWAESYMLGEIQEEEEVSDKIRSLEEEHNVMSPFYCDKAARFVFIMGNRAIYADGTPLTADFTGGDISASSTSILTRLGGELIIYGDGTKRQTPPDIGRTWDLSLPPPELEGDLRIILGNWERWGQENTDSIQIVLANEDGTVGVDLPSEVEDFLEATSEEEARRIRDEHSTDEDLDGDTIAYSPEEVVDLFGEEEDEVSLEGLTPKKREEALNAKLKEDEAIDPEEQARLEAILAATQEEQDRRAKEHKRQRDFEEGPGQILEKLKENGEVPDDSSARIRRVSDEGVVEEPLNIASQPQTITRAIKRLESEENEEQPKTTGGDTVVIPPDSRMNFDTLSGTPEPLTRTRDMGTKGKTPTLEEEGDESDSSMVEDKEQADPPKVGGEDPARAITRTSISNDNPPNKQTPKEDTMSETETAESMLEARNIQLDDEGNIVGRSKKLVKHPLSAWTDPETGTFKLLGPDPTRCQFRATDGKVEKFLDLIALADNLDDVFEHPYASQSNPDLMLSSRAPGSDDDIEDKGDDWDPDDEDLDLEDQESDTQSALDFLEDEKQEGIELDCPGIQDKPSTGSSDTTPAIPGTVASTEPSFADNQDEDLTQGGEDLKETKSNGEKPKDTKPEEDNMSKNDETKPDDQPKDTQSDAKPSEKDIPPALRSVEMIHVRGDFNGDGELVPKKVPLVHVFVGDNNIDGYNQGATSFKVGDDLFNEATLKQGEDSMTVFPLNELKLVEIVKRANDGTLTTEKVNEQLLRDPNDPNARGIYLNEEMTEFMKGNEPIGARVKLADNSGDIVAQVFAPNNVRTQEMLAATNNESEEDENPTRLQQAWNGFWAEQSNGRRALHVALPLLLVGLIVAFFSLPSGSESNTANKGDKTPSTTATPAASEDKPKKEETWLAAREHDSKYRDVRSDRHFTGTLDFRGTTGEVFPNAITNENVDEWILFDHNTVEKQDYDPTIGGFPLPYDINPVKLAEYSGSMGLNHPIYFVRLGVAEYDIRRNVQHTGPYHVKLLEPVRKYVAPDGKVCPVYTVSVSPEYQEVLDQKKAQSIEAYRNALPRVRASTYVRPEHMPSQAGTN